MSTIHRLVSLSVASAAAFGFIGAVGLAPMASAVPCSGDAANAPPPANAVVTAPSSKTLGPMTRGLRPRGANERAPLPKLGPLSRLLNPGARRSAPVQQQAAVPAPAPPSQPGFSKQIISSIKWAPDETGIIPTSGIAVGKTQYVSFMSIRDWGRDGEWTTNYSGIAVSKDNGQNWGVFPGTIRASGPDSGRVRFVPGNENFQMGAFVKANDGYLYSFGTPPGRGGSAYLARVPQRFVPDLTKYQYWNGDSNSWVAGKPGAATPVIPGPVGEMSAQYNTYLKQYLVMYTNGGNDVVARTAPTPQGPWSPEQMLVSSWQMPGGIYAPMMHPWSTGKDVYFNLSLWSAYNVMLMHTELA